MNIFLLFIKKLGVLLLLLVPVLVFVHSLESQKNTVDLSLISVCVFTILSILLFLMLHRSVKSPNRQLFISYTMLNTLVKMVLSITLLVVYKKVSHPSDASFIIPFLVIYVIFTIFETKFMLQIANQKP